MEDSKAASCAGVNSFSYVNTNIWGQATGTDNGHKSANKQSWNIWAECNCDKAKYTRRYEKKEALVMASHIGYNAPKWMDADCRGHVHSSWNTITLEAFTTYI
jgi:hypothetical protein